MTRRMNPNRRIPNSHVMLVTVGKDVSFYTTAGQIRNMVGNQTAFNRAVRNLMKLLDDDRADDLRKGIIWETTGYGRNIDGFDQGIHISKMPK